MAEKKETQESEYLYFINCIRECLGLGPIKAGGNLRQEIKFESNLESLNELEALIKADDAITPNGFWNILDKSKVTFGVNNSNLADILDITQPTLKRWVWRKGMPGTRYHKYNIKSILERIESNIQLHKCHLNASKPPIKAEETVLC